jgi:hypothetical protein
VNRALEGGSADPRRAVRSGIFGHAGGRPGARARNRGFTLLMVAVTLPVLVAVLGLAADLGRIYTVRNELQSFADTAALAACYELDGTGAGLARARTAGAAGPGAGVAANKWDFSNKTVTGAEVGFATSIDGPFEAYPANAENYRFVQVRTAVRIPLYFMGALPGVSTDQQVSARAIAGQAAEPALGDGLAPFSPDAHNPAAPDFGFTKGEMYTLKWPPPGQRDNPQRLCSGDRGFTPGGGSSERGYIDVGQGEGNSALHDTIVNNDFNLEQPVTDGSPLTMVSGGKNVSPAVEERFHQDTDVISRTYSEYHGNGRRLLVVAVNDHQDAAHVAGFAVFFLRPGSCGNSNVDACCAEYVGPGLVSARHKPAADGGGLYKVKLFR